MLDHNPLHDTQVEQHRHHEVKEVDDGQYFKHKDEAKPLAQIDLNRKQIKFSILEQIIHVFLL